MFLRYSDKISSFFIYSTVRSFIISATCSGMSISQCWPEDPSILCDGSIHRRSFVLYHLASNLSHRAEFNAFRLSKDTG